MRRFALIFLTLIALSTPLSAQQAGKTSPLIGLPTYSSEGAPLGRVHSIDADSAGRATGIHLKVGGFLGYGGKLVAVPEGKWTRSGDNIQLGMTSEQVAKLPALKTSK